MTGGLPLAYSCGGGTRSAASIMNEHTPAPPFSADRPITSSAEYRLNRRDFAFALGDSVLSWDGADSLVIGLNGKWGSGKNSIINLVLERIQRTAEPAPDTIKFNPWEWSGHEELATAFFREIEIALHDRKGAGSQLAERFERYASILNAGATLAESSAPVVTAASVVIVAAGGATIAVDPLSSPVAGGILLVTGMLGLIASRVSRVMQAIGAALRRPSKSLTEVKRDLTEALQKYDRNILVILDDIDRLTPSDVVRILQLVKANADFPKMVYLLAYDLSALSKSVEAALRVNGRDYVDKIVQVSVQVPKPDKSALEGLLFAGVDEVIEPASIQRIFNKDRWSSLYLDGYSSRGINSYFSTPRRIFRFVSALHFNLARHMDRGECNVDPVDFIGIEALRVFEGAVYEGVATEKQLFAGAASGDARQQERDKATVSHVLQKAPDDPKRSTAEHVLRELFPSAEWALTGTHQAVDRGRLLADRRVSHLDMFDFYFQMAVPTASLSEGEIREVVAATSASRETLTDALRVLIERGRIRAFLRDLAAGLDRIPRGLETVFISSLFDIGDQLEAQVERMLDASDTLRSEFIVEDLLDRLRLDERLHALEEAVEDSEGVALPLNFIRFTLHRADREAQPAIADEEGLRVLGQRLLPRIRGLASGEQLLNHRHLPELMYAWSFFGEEGDARSWAEEHTGTPEGLLRLFQAFAHYKGPDNAHPLSEYIDLDEAVARAERWLDSGELQPETAEGLRTALAAT